MKPLPSSPFNLTTLFSLPGLPADRDGDGLPETIGAIIVLAEGAELPEHLAAVDLAARLGFESLALEAPLARVDSPPGAPSTDQFREDDEARVPVFIGRPGTLSSGCPEPLARLLAVCKPGEGIVALSTAPRPAVLVGGNDAAGLRAAMLALVTDALDRAERLDDGAAGVEALRISESGGPDLPPAEERTAPPLRSLAQLFGPDGLAVDEDGDLLPDRSRTRLVFPSDLSPAEARAAVDLAARIGLETLGLALPLAAGSEDYLAADDELPIVVAPLEYARNQAASVGVGLSPTAVGQALPPDRSRGDQGTPAENAMGSEGRAGSVRLLSHGDGRQEIRVEGGAAGRGAALNALAALDAWDHARVPTLANLESGLERVLALADPAGALGAVMPAIDSLGPRVAALPPEPLRLTLRLPAAWPVNYDDLTACLAGWATHAFPRRPCQIAGSPVEPAIWLDETYTPSWEVDDAWRIMRAEIFPKLIRHEVTGRDWRLDLRISEPEGRRQAMRLAILAELRAAGLAPLTSQVRVLPAYHQGRAWLLEEVCPSLRGRDVAALLVRIRRFASEEPCLELPIRWLQDLFPADELLAERLDLPITAVRFELHDTLPSTYEVEAFDAEGHQVLRDGFDVVTTTHPYLFEFPSWGAVSPPTGCIRLTIGGQLVADHRLATDPERMWRWLQDTILPRLGSTIRAHCGGSPRREQQPFFGELEIAAWLSEDDGPLGVREERNSSLECLHEDTYFVLLDYCTALMTAGDEQPYTPPWLSPGDESRARRDARRWTAPGRIVPRIHRRDGMAGQVRVRVRAPSPGASLEWACGDARGAVPLRPAHGVRVRVVELEVADHTDPAARPLTAVIALDGPDEEARHGRAILRALGHLWRAGLDPAPGVSRTWAIRVEGEASDTSLIAPESRRVPPGRLGAGDLALRGSDEGRPGALDDEAKTAGDPVPWDRVLSREEVNRAISRLGALPHVHSFVAGWSALGRPLWAMEVTAPRRRGWWSRAKLSGWKCSLLLNGRHHANEPASTSAMLRLAELLATEDAERRFLDRVNVIFLPGENADGMDLDDALVAEHPNWMHHAARYNAAGLEFTSAYRDPATPHTEALALPALWRQWAPDIVCDNHGFPSHAWEQPFSGHANPWFRAFWIPQALIYAYLPSADTPEHRTATQAIGERLVEMLGSDSEIARWNDQHALHYKTYLHNQLPERFPAPYERGVLLHRSIHDPKEGDPGMTGHAGRFSAVTTASLITEVADETAQGDYLALCARAHLLANRALLEYLYQANGPAGVRRIMARTPDGRTLLRATRPRPVQPQANWPDQMARRAGPGPSDPIASP